MIGCSWVDGSWQEGAWVENTWNGCTPPIPVPITAEARIGGGGVYIKVVDALDDDALLLALLAGWMER